VAASAFMKSLFTRSLSTAWDRAFLTSESHEHHQDAASAKLDLGREVVSVAIISRGYAGPRKPCDAMEYLTSVPYFSCSYCPLYSHGRNHISTRLFFIFKNKSLLTSHLGISSRRRWFARITYKRWPVTAEDDRSPHLASVQQPSQTSLANNHDHQIASYTSNRTPRSCCRSLPTSLHLSSPIGLALSSSVQSWRRHSETPPISSPGGKGHCQELAALVNTTPLASSSTTVACSLSTAPRPPKGECTALATPTAVLAVSTVLTRSVAAIRSTTSPRINSNPDRILPRYGEDGS
jgi:hypothetical protein